MTRAGSTLPWATPARYTRSSEDGGRPPRSCPDRARAGTAYVYRDLDGKVYGQDSPGATSPGWSCMAARPPIGKLEAQRKKQLSLGARGSSTRLPRWQPDRPSATRWSASSPSRIREKQKTVRFDYQARAPISWVWQSPRTAPSVAAPRSRCASSASTPKPTSG